MPFETRTTALAVAELLSNQPVRMRPAPPGTLAGRDWPERLHFMAFVMIGLATAPDPVPSVRVHSAVSAFDDAFTRGRSPASARVAAATELGLDTRRRSRATDAYRQYLRAFEHVLAIVRGLASMRGRPADRFHRMLLASRAGRTNFRGLFVTLTRPVRGVDRSARIAKEGLRAGEFDYLSVLETLFLMRPLHPALPSRAEVRVHPVMRILCALMSAIGGAPKTLAGWFRACNKDLAAARKAIAANQFDVPAVVSLGAGAVRRVENLTDAELRLAIKADPTVTPENRPARRVALVLAREASRRKEQMAQQIMPSLRLFGLIQRALRAFAEVANGLLPALPLTPVGGAALRGTTPWALELDDEPVTISRLATRLVVALLKRDASFLPEEHAFRPGWLAHHAWTHDLDAIWIQPLVEVLHEVLADLNADPFGAAAQRVELPLRTLLAVGRDGDPFQADGRFEARTEAILRLVRLGRDVSPGAWANRLEDLGLAVERRLERPCSHGEAVEAVASLLASEAAGGALVLPPRAALRAELCALLSVEEVER